MFRKIFILILFTMFFIPAVVFAFGDSDDSSSSDSCRTKYPIILAHGMGASAEISAFGIKIMDYWYKIPETLEDRGANVYVTSLNGMDSTENKAIEWRKQFLEILAISGATKANVIGHSHGTIYTRYAISNLGLASKVATHTSLSGPHRGSSLASLLDGIISNSGGWILADVLDVVYTYLFGDVNPDSTKNFADLDVDYMINTFNPNTPNVNGIYYQSWASKKKFITMDFIFEIPWAIMLYYEGPNDGLVSIPSAKWGDFRGTKDGAWWCGGVSHLNICNMFLGITPGFDSPAFFVDIVSELKNKGY